MVAVKIKKLKYTQEHVELCNTSGCSTCPTRNTWDKLTNPCIATWGSEKPLIYFVNKAPTKSDDAKDQYFSDKAHTFIKHQIPLDFIDLVAFTGVVRCAFSGRAVNINWQTKESCRTYFNQDFLVDKPKVIVGFGSQVLEWAINETSISGWRGRWVPINILRTDCWFYPIEDINEIIADYKTYPEPFTKAMKSARGQTLLKDLQNFFDEINSKEDPVVYPPKDVYKNIHPIVNGTEFSIEQIYNTLDYFNEKEDGVGIDIETNCIRPYKTGSKILSIAIGTKNNVISIPLRHKQSPWDEQQLKTVEETVVDFLYNTQCRKICFSTAFELEWFSYFYGADILTAGVWEDAAAQAYVLHHRLGSSSLDATCLHRFGLPLKSFTTTHIEALDDDPLEDVLRYNAGDSKFTHKLFYIQEKELERMVSEKGISGTQIYDQQMLRIPTLVRAQLKGVNIDKPVLDQFEGELSAQIKELEVTLSNIKERKQYEKIHGPLDLDSPTQIKILLKDFIKDPACITKNKDGSNKFSSAKDVLEKIDHPFTENLMKYRRVAKLYSTYIKPLYGSDEKPSLIYDDGKVHTSFNALLTTTRRLCVAGDTAIETVRDLSKQPSPTLIKDIKVGDLVYGFDDNLQPTVNEVLWQGHTGKKKVIRLHWKTKGKGTSTGYLDVTPNHKIRLVTGAYIEAKDVLPGQSVLATRHNHIITRIEYLDNPVDVYDLEIKDSHNFIANEICVHNSSNSPNLQNQPKHNDAWLRKYFIPKPGCKFVSVDYGQIEARIIALVSRDNNFIQALWDNYDIHAEWAERIFKLYPKIVPEKAINDKVVFKKLRDRMKNQFVFPSFFGASDYSIAEDLNVPVELIKKIKKEFWKQFMGVRSWQQSMERFYAENGYVESYFGYRRYAPLSYNDLINAPIQSSASDIVVDVMNRLSDYAVQTKQEQFQAEINVHDDLIFSIPVDSLEKDSDIIVQKMLNTFPDILKQIPITVEMSMGDNWAEMKEVGKYSSADLIKKVTQ